MMVARRRDGGCVRRWRRCACSRGQCSRTSPCAHAGHMARRLALLAMLLVWAVTALPPRRPASLDSDSSDSYPFEDDYDVSNTPSPRPLSTKPTRKVTLNNKNQKVNVTMKNNKDKKKVIKTTNIKIESHTNFVDAQSQVTVKPKPSVWSEAQHIVGVNGHYVWVEKPGLKRPQGTGLRPAHSTQRPTARPVRTTKRRTTTRRTTPKPKRRTTTKPKKTTQRKKTTCAPKKPQLVSTLFVNNKIKKTSKKKPKQTGWFSGMFSKMFNWMFKGTWLGSWFSKPAQTKPTTIITTTTTTPAPVQQTSSWFQSFLESEESDVTFTSNDVSTKKSMKKSIKKNYKGYQLLRAYPDAPWKVHDMLDLQEEGDGSGLMWWTTPSMNGSTDVLVPPDLLADVKDNLKSSKVDFDVIIWDLQKAIMYENPRLSKKQRLELEQLRGHPMTWRRYHRYADILRYLEYLQHSYADLVELVPLGRSSEGLPLVAVKISMALNETDNKDKTSKKKWKLRSQMKPAVWMDGGAHAREWIAPAVATWIIQALVEGEKGLGAEYEVLKQADFYILPVLNPDGYEHSHTHDRLWKKTRSRPGDHEDYFTGWFPWNWGQTECIGVDADRNWDFHWGEKDSSRDACADNYVGPHPFSEPETRAVSDFLAENRGQIKVYISLHAYSQTWMLPSSHAQAPFSDDGVLMEMAKLATAALADMYGTKYKLGSAAEIRQPASGMAHDWAKARAGIKFSYHVDLRDSVGPYGFLLPGSQIVSTARETWQAIKAIVDNLTPG